VVDILNKEKNVFEIQSRANQSSRKKIFKVCVENNWTLTEMTPIETKLEDIFRELTLS
jgi:ABC-2 type transport system ATP-binding protein